MSSALIHTRTIDAILRRSTILSTLIDVPIEQELKTLDEDMFPLISSVISNRIPENTVNSWSVRIPQNRYNQRIFTANADATATAQDLSITNSSSYFQRGGILYNPRTNEQIMLITEPDADLSTNTPYLRAQASVGVAILTGDVLVYMGRAGDAEEKAPNAYHERPLERTYWSEIHRDYAVKSTWSNDVQQNEINFNDFLWNMDLKEKMLMWDLENKAFFSRGSSNIGSGSIYMCQTTSTTSTDIRPKMTGFIDAIYNYGEYWTDMGTTPLTYGTFENIMKGPATWHKGDWVCFLSRDLIVKLKAWPVDYFQSATIDLGFGNRELRYIDTGYGKVYLVAQNWWTDGALAEQMCILPLPITDHVYMFTSTGREGTQADGHTKWYMGANNQGIAQDDHPLSTKYELMCIKGLAWREPEKFCYISSVKNAA